MQLHKVLYCVLAMSDQNMSLISSPAYYSIKINRLLSVSYGELLHKIIYEKRTPL